MKTIALLFKPFSFASNPGKVLSSLSWWVGYLSFIWGFLTIQNIDVKCLKYCRYSVKFYPINQSKYWKRGRINFLNTHPTWGSVTRLVFFVLFLSVLFLCFGFVCMFLFCVFYLFFFLTKRVVASVLCLENPHFLVLLGSVIHYLA